MNKPIVQLVVFLFIVILATFVLSRFDSFYVDDAIQPDDSLKMLLSSKKTVLVGLKDQQIVNRNSEISLYRFIERIKADLAKGKYKKAENNLRNLLLFYPNNRTVLSLLGGVLYSSGKYEQAREMFMLMLENNPDDSFVREGMAITLRKQHRYTEAIEEFLHASLLKPESASMYLHLAGLYSIVGDKKRAIYNFAKAYEIIDVNIIPLSFDPAFNNIRDMPMFINIINNAEEIVRIRDNIYLKKENELSKQHFHEFSK
jgi:tetratricopeptide (TPR) repeat protein